MNILLLLSLIDAKAGGATNATARAIKFKMQPDEAMKILSIERHEFSREVLDQVSNSLYQYAYNFGI